MLKHTTFLLSPDGGDGGGGGDPSLLSGSTGGGDGDKWFDVLPQEIREEPSIQQLKGIPELAQSFVSAQKLIGEKRIVAPKETWTDEEWGNFYAQLGRPGTPQGYKLPDVKWEEGLSWDDTKVTDALQGLHGLGLNQKQAEGVLQMYADTLNGAQKGHRESVEQGSAKAMEALHGKWGDDYDANLDMARGALRKFGSEDFINELERTGLGNNPALIEAFHGIAGAMLEDHARGKGADVLQLGNAATAKKAITDLETDADFMKAYTTRDHPGHAAAVERMGTLRKAAYPGKSE